MLQWNDTQISISVVVKSDIMSQGLSRLLQYPTPYQIHKRNQSGYIDSLDILILLPNSNSSIIREIFCRSHVYMSNMRTNNEKSTWHYQNPSASIFIISEGYTLNHFHQTNICFGSNSMQTDSSRHAASENKLLVQKEGMMVRPYCITSLLLNIMSSFINTKSIYQ